MAIDYKKLLPQSLQNGRWGEYIETFQYLVDEKLIPEKIDIIKNQFILDEMTAEQISDLAYTFGFSITSSTGYTETLDYLQKEILTVVPRIINKTTRIGFSYLYYIFNLRGDVYPCIKEEDGLELDPVTFWWTSTEDPQVIETLDSDVDNLLYKIPYKLDTALTEFDSGFILDSSFSVYSSPQATGLPAATLDDEENFATLDLESYLSRMTRHILLSYSFKVIESLTDFITEETCRAIYNDTNQVKRKIEIPHFEVVIPIETDTSVSGSVQSFYNYDKTLTADLESVIILPNDITSATQLQLGVGAHSVIGQGITGVEDIEVTLDIASNFNTIVDTGTELHLRGILTAVDSFYNFSEIALLDVGGNCLYYATFPRINWYDQMNASIYLKIDVI